MLNVDATLLRILLIVITVFSSGALILVYILVGLVVPKESNPFGGFGPGTGGYNPNGFGPGGYNGGNQYGSILVLVTVAPYKPSRTRRSSWWSQLAAAGIFLPRI